MNILFLCGSCKPAAQKANSQSACRQLMRIVEASVQKQGWTTTMFDLRELNLPWFEGLQPEDYPNSDLDCLAQAIQQASIMFIAVPAYWGGVAGGLKNCLDLLGGAAYDKKKKQTPFANTLVGLLIVGADNNDADLADGQSRTILERLGAICLPESLIINSPRHIRSEELVFRSWNYGQYMAEYLTSTVVSETINNNGDYGSTTNRPRIF